MDIERFCIKFFAKPWSDLDDAIYIDIFHEWIRHKKLDGILLDVVDYRHVPEGPGIMLITHEINFAMDYLGDQFGLFAQRKLGRGVAFPERILELARATVAFGVLLETDPRVAGRLALDGGVFHFVANDRLLAPNTPEAYAALRPSLEAAAGLIYPDQTVSIRQLDNDPRDRLTISVEATSVPIGDLFEPLGVVA